VHSAAIQDRAAVPVVWAGIQAECSPVEHVWGAQGETGRGQDGCEAQLGWRVEVGRRPPNPRGVGAPIAAVIERAALCPRGFRGVLPRRWVIERTFRWCGQSRRRRYGR
jgi:putative transposase